ncbi:MAG: gamma-glutamyltransferase family protein [Phycisphaerales bacterium]|nr:gamma-glutamyltransferase family protein [Phycisphaerales bacterium]
MNTAMDWTLPYDSRRMPVCAGSTVATSQPLAATAAIDVLRDGGNAVDAAIAAAMALTVVEPCSNGIGGDAFAMVHDGTRLHGLNASGRAPRSWSIERFAGHDRMPTLGWDAVTVPGAVSGWAALSERFGTMPLTRLAQAACDYARDGFPVSPQAANSWERARHRYESCPQWQQTFAPHGRAPRPGERFSCPAQADSLEAIASSNGQDFYTGDLARRIVEAAAADGGALDATDLARHEPLWVEPLSIPYRDRMLHELPPNGQGLVPLVAAALLDRFDVSMHEPDDPALLHLQIESIKHAFALCKPELGCPDSMRRSPESLLDSKQLDAIAATIAPDAAHDPGHVVVTDASTVYLAVGDANGMMVSYIQSNYMGFGSGIVVPDTGIAMQNRGAGFVLEPGHPNAVAGGRRPYHTIIPGFISRNGAPEIAFGVMGGHMQPQGHLQVLSHLVDAGRNPQAALDAPRWRIDQGCRVHLEPGFSSATIDGLRTRGHAIEHASERSVAFGGGQVVQRIEADYVAGSDSRRDGLAMGR